MKLQGQSGAQKSSLGNTSTHDPLSKLHDSTLQMTSQVVFSYISSVQPGVQSTGVGGLGAGFGPGVTGGSLSGLGVGSGPGAGVGGLGAGSGFVTGGSLSGLGVGSGPGAGVGGLGAGSGFVTGGSLSGSGLEIGGGGRGPGLGSSGSSSSAQSTSSKPHILYRQYSSHTPFSSISHRQTGFTYTSSGSKQSYPSLPQL